MTLTAITVFKQDEAKKRFEEVLGKNAWAYITTVMSVIASSNDLKEADPKTVFTAALTAAALNLPVNPNLGRSYIIPYKNKKEWVTVAQFQIWYKWFIELAQRSGLYEEIEAKPVYKWQVVEDDSFTGYHFDRKNKESNELIGYAAYMKLLNGFKKILFMTMEELKEHWLKYSASYKRDKSQWKKSSLWTTDFDAMAQKTVLKLLISKYWPLSTDPIMQKAVASDQWVLWDTDWLDVEYPDNDQDEINSIDMDEKLKEITPAKEDDSKQESLLDNSEKDVK